MSAVDPSSPADTVTQDHDPRPSTWATAREAYDYRGRRGWVHAYDLLQHTVPHPLGGSYDVDETEIWLDDFAGPRCQHCIEIVNHTTSPTT